MRAILARTLKYFMEKPLVSFADQLHALRAITYAITCLQVLCKTQGTLFKDKDNEKIIADYMHQLRLELGKIPPEED